jgi:hypothetical protein
MTCAVTLREVKELERDLEALRLRAVELEGRAGLNGVCEDGLHTADAWQRSLSLVFNAGILPGIEEAQRGLTRHLNRDV